MAEDDPGRASGMLDTLGNNITKVGVIVGAVVALNTAVTTYSNDRIARYTSFRDTVNVEETYWKGLYDDYLSTFEAEIMADQERRERKLFAISNLANHSVPDFGEFSVGESQKQQATLRLTMMRANLIDALQDRRASTDSVAESALAASFAADEAAKGRNEKPAVTQAQVALAADTANSGDVSISYQTRVVAAGSPKGWDVDVFWCQGPDEEIYAGRAQAAADVLARHAKAGDLLAPGVTLGAIRVRTLPTYLQERGGYPTNGSVVVFDAGPGEDTASIALEQMLQKEQPGDWRRVKSYGQSKWYLSLFLCPVKAPPSPAPPLPAPS